MHYVKEGPYKDRSTRFCETYLAHIFLAHSKLVVAQQERPDLLPDFVLNATIINQPEQLQLLIVLHTHTHT